MRRLFFAIFCLSLLLALPAFAQGGTPSVSVSNQISLNGRVMIDSAFSDGPGFVVIHVDNNGQPGRVAGFASVAPGWTYNLEIPIDAAIATPTLYAMLHVDDGEVGKYEFDGQSGFDNPVIVNGQVVTPPFQVNIIDAHDQFVDGDTVTIASVTVQVDGWLVIHSDNNGAPGPVLGQERVLAGTTNNVDVTLQADGRTEVLFPMLHTDTGTAGEYEFGIVEGADPPVVVRGVVATTPIWTVPHVRVDNQAVVHGDGQGDPATSLHVESVLAEVAGWLVIHSDNNNAPGPVAGFLAVPAGYSADLTVEGLNPANTTPVLWPMLHIDDNTVGEYEFGSVQGADAPVLVDGQVLTFPINAAPSLTMHDQDPLPGESTGTIRFVVDEALMDAPGWLAIHTNNGGQPGPVIGTALLHTGSNKNVRLEVDAAQAADQVFPMLHYDTGTVGEYEFGTVDGADLPVFVSGAVVVAPLRLTTAPPAETPAEAPTAAPTEVPAAAPTAAPAQPTGACTVASASGGPVNRRTGPSTAFSITGQLASGQTAGVTAQTTGADGFVWYQTDDGSFVRSDVVTTSGDCSTVPALAGLPAPAAPVVPPPNATQEASS